MSTAISNSKFETTKKAPHMQRYMPDNVFDGCVIVALSAFFSRQGYGYIDREVRGAFSTYFRNYDNDEFVRQGVVAAERVMDRLNALPGPDKGVADYLDQLAYCVKTRWPNGTKRKRKFLSWMRRGYATQPNFARAETFLVDFEGYSSTLKDQRIYL